MFTLNPVPVVQENRTLLVFYYIIDSASARPSPFRITGFSLPLLGQTHLLVVFGIKRRTGHPGSSCWLFAHQSPEARSRWLEKRRKGGAYYNNCRRSPAAVP